jgi:hypothetical protein
VIHSIMGVSSEIVDIGFQYMIVIVKYEGRNSLEGCSAVLKVERNLSVCECTPRKNKCHLMLVLGPNLNLVIS